MPKFNAATSYTCNYKSFNIKVSTSCCDGRVVKVLGYPARVSPAPNFKLPPLDVDGIWAFSPRIFSYLVHSEG